MDTEIPIQSAQQTKESHENYDKFSSETDPLYKNPSEKRKQNPEIISTRGAITKEGYSVISKEVGGGGCGTSTAGEGTGTTATSKDVFARLPLFKLWFVLLLTIGFTTVLLTAAHLTHSLTLRVEAYHGLYNLLALAGCLFTMKICERPSSIKNTFGWARVELLSCLCTLLFIASLCFSVTLESIQTAAHAGHQDAMHHPLPVIALGGIGLVLNAIVFCLIGGYTHHQGCFLEKRPSGVWVQRRVTQDAAQAGMRTLLSHHNEEKVSEAPLHRSYQGLRGVCRDISGLVVLMLCGAVVLWDHGKTLALYVDPGFAVMSSIILLYLSIPYGKECCQILLQTIPGNIDDVQSFSARLLQEFPEVVNVHHLHIWSLAPGKVIATAHVVYSNPKVYRNSITALEQFFFDREITKVTLQPEFLHFASASSTSLGYSECLLQCANTLCRQKECCMDCPEKKDVEEGGSSVVLPKKTPFSLSYCLETESREQSICKDHHGTSAFRNSTVDLTPVFKCVPRRTKSKEDVSHKSTERVSKLPRSYSCQLSTADDDVSCNKNAAEQEM